MSTNIAQVKECATRSGRVIYRIWRPDSRRNFSRRYWRDRMAAEIALTLNESDK